MCTFGVDVGTSEREPLTRPVCFFLYRPEQLLWNSRSHVVRAIGTKFRRIVFEQRNPGFCTIWHALRRRDRSGKVDVEASIRGQGSCRGLNTPPKAWVECVVFEKASPEELSSGPLADPNALSCLLLLLLLLFILSA